MKRPKPQRITARSLSDEVAALREEVEALKREIGRLKRRDDPAPWLPDKPFKPLPLPYPAPEDEWPQPDKPLRPYNWMGDPLTSVPPRARS